MSATTKARHRRRADPGGSAAGNERLTAMTGAVLLAVFAAEGVTILRLHRLLTLHFFLGMLLLGPVALKCAATGYRFIRYYAGSVPYRRKGPPAPVMRMLGPLVMASSLAVLGTGVVLAVTGPGSGPWPTLHKLSFLGWFAVMTVHVLVYAPRLPRILLGGRVPGRASAVLAGAAARWLLLAGSLAAGLAIAAATMHLSARWGG